MGETKSHHVQWVCALTLLAALAGAGCTGSGQGVDSNDALALLLGLGTGTNVVEGGRNSSFDAPTPFRLVAGRRRVVQGTLESAGDIDLYELGAVDAGDRLVIEVVSQGALDAAAAVFDADENLIYLNDDRDYFGGRLDPQINVVFRRDSARCFVAVASSPQSPTSGDYTLSASLTVGGDAPEVQPQVVLLNFDGARAVEFGGRAPVDIPPFDAGDISAVLSGRDSELIELVLDRVRDDYEGLNVEIHSSREGAPPMGSVSTIHFGAEDSVLLGVAESVDEFNEHPVQEAIVFTDTFRAFNVLAPTIEEYAQALANVASHEIGHLLGLVHTRDTRGVMDISASLRQLMRNQAFLQSPLDDALFPTGFQNAVVTLVDGVGGDAEYVQTLSLAQLGGDRRAALKAGLRDARIDPPRVVLSSCSVRTPEVLPPEERVASLTVASNEVR